MMCIIHVLIHFYDYLAPPSFKRKKYSHFGKNPTVDTSFLPDRDREVRGKEGREREAGRERGREGEGEGEGGRGGGRERE